MTASDRVTVDLLDPALYQRNPHDVWAWMRANEPVYRDDRNGDGQWTVVTALFGDLKGRRIVRGREPECRAQYVRSASINVLLDE